MSLLRRPLDLPASLKTHRLQLFEEQVLPVLRARAEYPSIEHLWIRETIQQAEKVLQEVNTWAEAVMEYELSRCESCGGEPEDCTRWVALAVRRSDLYPMD